MSKRYDEEEWIERTVTTDMQENVQVGHIIELSPGRHYVIRSVKPAKNGVWVKGIRVIYE